MKGLKFYKYHGAGNDFVAIDNRNNNITLSKDDIKKLCHRRFGIGADGLFLLEIRDDVPYMDFYNSDGSDGIMCGNGGRCAAHFAKELMNIAEDSFIIKTIQGNHGVEIKGKDLVSIDMYFDGNYTNIDGFYISESETALHALVPVIDLGSVDIDKIAKPIRAKYNVNVNFYEEIDGKLNLRTFERGVEGETLACGTGALATAILLHHFDLIRKNSYDIQMPGGLLNISFDYEGGEYKNIVLTGPIKQVSSGIWTE